MEFTVYTIVFVILMLSVLLIISFCLELYFRKGIYKVIKVEKNGLKTDITIINDLGKKQKWVFSKKSKSSKNFSSEILKSGFTFNIHSLHIKSNELKNLKKDKNAWFEN